MKHLFIYRHADALPSSRDQKDHERNLSSAGVEECRTMGNFLKNNPLKPDFALCSTARRTRTTLEVTCNAMEQPLETRFEESLYLASIEDIYAQLHGVENYFQAPIIIAHNPGLHAFCQSLAKEGDPVGQNILIHQFPPATLALFSLDTPNWQSLSPQTESRLIFLKLAHETVTSR